MGQARYLVLVYGISLLTRSLWAAKWPLHYAEDQLMGKERRQLKGEALRQCGCLHPHPEEVSDDLYESSHFFDRRDLVQVKYEMLRSVRVDGLSVSESAARSGLSRPVYYQTQAAFDTGGLPALQPKKPGPRRAHKLSEEVMQVLRAELSVHPSSSIEDLRRLIEKRFGLSVHPRSIERALARTQKKRQ